MIHPVMREKQRLDTVFALVAQVPAQEEVLAHWAKYLCVLASGFIENSLRLLLQAYADQHSKGPITNYVSSRLSGLTNLNDEKIAQLLGSFSPTWRDTFIALRTPQQKDAIDSVLANRHLIAHGRPVGITFIRMKNYYAEIAKVIRMIDEDCINK